MTKSRIVTIDSEADPLLSASCSALHLQYQLDNKLILQIVSIQQSIKRVLNDALFCCPPQSLHMTILTPIPARPELASHTGAAWCNAGRPTATPIVTAPTRLGQNLSTASPPPPNALHDF